jgi:hypothetical protein
VHKFIFSLLTRSNRVTFRLMEITRTIGYAAFLDIMGFTSRVLSEGPEGIDTYLECLRLSLDVNGSAPLIEYVVFSDSIVVTTADDTLTSLQALLEHFSIRLGVSRVREISVAFLFGDTFEKRGDCSPKFLNGARLHFA